MTTTILVSAVAFACTLLAACDGPIGDQAQAAATTDAQAPSRPRAVQAAIDEATRECRAHGGRFVAGPDLDRRLALNGDEAPDHVLDFGSATCDGADDDYFGAARGGRRDDGCGRAGCRVQVFLSGTGGHQRVFSEPVWEVQLVRDTEPARLRFSALDMPGCAASSAEGCHAEWGWNGTAFVHQRWLRREDVAVNASQDDAGGAGPVGRSAISAKPGSSGVLPFAEGDYGMGDKQFVPLTGDYAYPSVLYVSATEFGAYPLCPVLDVAVQGAEARLTYQCPDYCEAGHCSAVPRSVATIRALGPDRVSISIRGDMEYMSGEYTHAGQGRR